MTDEQLKALTIYFTENNVDLEDLHNVVSFQLSVRKQVDDFAKTQRLESEKAKLMGRCFYDGEAYYKVVSLKGGGRMENVACLVITENPVCVTENSYIYLESAMEINEVNYEHFQAYKEITVEQFNEAFIRCAKAVLELEFK